MSLSNAVVGPKSKVTISFVRTKESEARKYVTDWLRHRIPFVSDLEDKKEVNTVTITFKVCDLVNPPEKSQAVEYLTKWLNGYQGYGRISELSIVMEGGEEE